MTIFRRLTLSVLALLLASVPLHAQTDLYSTTLSAAVADGTTQVLTVASTSNLAVGNLLFVDREAMLVQTVTPLKVTRGTRGTVANSHGSGAKVWYGATSWFGSSIPRGGMTKSGSCTRANQRYLPYIALPAGDIYDCPTSAAVWVYLNDPASIIVTCRMLLIADMVDQSCFTADRSYVITGITEVHKVAEASGTLTMIPRKQTGTQAVASGTALATAIDGVTTGNAAQTVKQAVLTTTSTALRLAPGDRIGIDFTDDTAGELADVLWTFSLSPQ